MTDEERRIRSYLQGQGAKLSPAEVIDKVRAAMAELRAAAASVAPERFDERPAPDEWSANEVMAHVITAGKSFGGRIVQVLDGASAVPSVTEPSDGTPPRRTALEWCAELERDRDSLFTRVLGTDSGVQVGTTIDHPMFGPLTWRETLLFLRLHDLDHAGQLRKIAAALGGSPAI